MRLLLLFCAALAATADTLVVKTTPGSGEYAATPAGLNSAISDAICGDTITIEAGAAKITIDGSGDTITLNKTCAEGNELLITADTSVMYFPPTGGRVNRGYVPLMPQILVTGNLAAAPAFRIPGAATGIIFRFIDVRIQQMNSTYFIFLIGDDTPESESDLADLITFDRSVVDTDFDEVNTFSANMIHAYIKKLTVTGCYFEDIRKSLNSGVSTGEGYHIYISNESRGPFVITNNYFGGGSSISILTGGGGGANFQVGSPPANYTVEHNFFVKDKRFYPGAANYVGDANRPGLKNLFELKQGTDAVIRYNGFDNSFAGNYGAQDYGLTFTIRNIYWYMGTTAALDMARTEVTVTGFSNPSGLAAPAAGAAMCLAIAEGNTGVVDTSGTTVTKVSGENLPAAGLAIKINGVGYMVTASNGSTATIATSAGTQDDVAFEGAPSIQLPGNYECKLMTAVNNTTRVYNVGSAFSGSVQDDTVGFWALGVMPWGGVQDILVEGNRFRNIGAMALALCTDESGEGSALSGLILRNNLIVNEDPLMSEAGNVYQSTLAYLKDACPDTLIDHNTMISRTSIGDTEPPLYGNPPYAFLWSENPAGTPHGALKVRSNIGSQGYWGSPLFQSGISLMNFWNTATSDGALEFLNNIITDLAAGTDWVSLIENCSGSRMCADTVALEGAIESLFRDPTPPARDYRLAVSSPYEGAGHDAADIGANLALVPAIRNIVPTPTPTTVTFAYQPAGITETRAVSLEISEDAGLVDQDGDYSPAALDPTAGTANVGYDDVNGNVTGSGTATRSWLVSGLTPSTTYYWRMMSGGLTETGTFTTLNPPAAAGHRLTLQGGGRLTR